MPRAGRGLAGSTCVRLGSLLLYCVAGLAAAAATEVATETDKSATGAPALQLADAGFPELLIRRAGFAIDGSDPALACDRIRPRRIDELDPRWRRIVQRIHLECEPLAALQDGEADTIATVVTAYLRAGTARLLDSPVAELRLMDSDLWSDHQYVLDAPYHEIVDSLQTLLVARCQATRDDPAALARHDCKVTRTGHGMFIDSSAVGGSWVHPDPHDPRRTVYAEAWAE